MSEKEAKDMFISVDLCLIPIGVGVSLSPFIAICQKEIEESGLSYQLEANGTAIEGNWEKVFACIKSCHEKIHQAGAPRIYTSLKVNSRTDKTQSFKEKVESVRSILD